MRRGIGLVALLLLVGSAVACGDDDGGTDTPDSGPMADVVTPPPPRDMGPREDTGPRDMGPADMGPRDMGPPVDMGPPPEACERAGVSEDMACGMCGTLTRFCTSGLTWEYGPCEGEHGVCNAGDTGSVECGDMMVDARCSDACIWTPIDEMIVCPLPLCTDPLMLAGRMGETVSVSFDTSMGPPGPLDLGEFCGGGFMLDPMLRPPQIVVALSVPGTGVHAVDLTLINDATDVAFDTVVQVRTDCMTAPVGGGSPAPGMPAPGCFDDSPGMGMTDFRSSGRFAAMGGETVYLLITGYAYGGMPPMERTVSGAARLDVTIGGELHAPTLTMATVTSNPEETRITVVGGDLDGDASSLRVTFLNAAGMPVDLNDDGVVDARDDQTLLLDAGVMGMMSFTTSANVAGPFISEQLAAAMATQARITLVDATGGSSAPLTVGVALVTLVDFGGACDAMNACRAPFVCTMATCQATPEATAACTAATAIPLTGTPAMGSVTGTLLPGTGLFEGGCGSSPGTEALYRVTVPAGSWDLIASNQVAGTPMGTDTVLYVRRTCGDARSESACNDDDGDSRSRAIVQNAMPGDYTVFQERFGETPVGMTTMYGLEVRLRPVIAAGAACDPMEVMNRCATGPCPMMTPVCPPAPPTP